MSDKEELIPPATNSLSSMFEEGKAIVPEGLPEVHKIPLTQVDNPSVAATGSGKEGQPMGKQEPAPLKFKRGDVVMDMEKLTKVVVVRTGVAFSPKGVPYHRVVHKRSGEDWLQRETKLKKFREDV